MRICFLADGGSIHTARWCKHFVEKKYDVHLITYRDAKIEGVTVHFIDAGIISSSGGNWKVILTVGQVKRVLKSIRPDVLHAQYATSYGLVGALSGFHPYIVTALGTDVLISPDQSFLYKMLIRYVLKKADWITAMSDFMKTKIETLGVSPGKIAVVMFGIDAKIFNRKGRHLEGGKFVITSTRNFEPVYNHPLFLKALSIVKDKIPGLEVNMIGDGAARKEIELLAAELELDQIVKFPGRIPQSKIAETLNRSHVFVSVSLSDGNNVSLNEAMACGAVSIASNIPANVQWINEGVNGFLVPVNDPAKLAEKILDVYYNYEKLQKSTIAYNDVVIPAKALWENNVAIVENKYLQLFGK